MVDFSRLRKGSKVKYVSRKDKRNNKKPELCKVVYVFKAGKVPKKKKIIKYYGKDIIDPKYSNLFGPNKRNRIVLKRGKNDYIVIPGSDRIFNYCYLSVVKY